MIEAELAAINDRWEEYQQAVKAIPYADTEGLRRVNNRLGYNVVKSMPALLLRLERAEDDAKTLRDELLLLGDVKLSRVATVVVERTEELAAELDEPTTGRKGLWKNERGG